MSGYPFDEDLLAEVAQRLFQSVPAMHRLPDQPPAGRGELARMLEVLAVPLAVLRQSVQELHADLFIDTAADQMIPYLAGLVGTDLVFPDPDSNRLDVRGTVGWRRRKGTPAALEEMGSDLTAQSVVMLEGWKRVQITQDLNLLRAGRVTPDLRPAVVAEQVSGPLDAMAHVVDVRASTVHTGRYHPRDVAHYIQPTVTFPLPGATPVSLSVPGSDIRFAMEPSGARRGLRARRPAGDRSPFLDRIQERHFAADPGRWFGRDEGFTVAILGLPAGIALPAGTDAATAADRTPAATVADRVLGRGTVRLTALDLPRRGWRGPVRIELGMAAVGGLGSGTWHPTASFDVRSTIELDAAGMLSTTPAGTAALGGVRVPLLRITTPGATGRFLPGVILELASDHPGAATAAPQDLLASEGFLRGVLHVAVPPLQIAGDRMLLVAADGSLYDGGTTAAPRSMPEAGGEPVLAPDARLTTGPGPAWPPLPARAQPDLVTSVPSAHGRGPAVAHGAVPVRVAGGTVTAIPAAAASALTFAMQVDSPGGAAFRPFQRLAWAGGDPAGGQWEVLGADGLPVSAAAAPGEYAQVAGDRERLAGSFALAVRFECSEPGASLCPGEVAWTGDDGTTVLIHLPQLDAVAPGPGDPWPLDPRFSVASEPVRAGQDGSTWASGSTASRRMSLGAVAPITQAAGLRRRVVSGRRLCAWSREDWAASPPETLPLTPDGHLDVDVMHGLFAFSAAEPPLAWPPGPAGPPPPNVTCDQQDAATMQVGARPAAREPVLNRRLPAPTRLVSRNGVLQPGTPRTGAALPVYPSPQAALDAISAGWLALTADDVAAAGGQLHEVVQFEDSASYPVAALTWPSPPPVAARLSLTVQAAERERPMLLMDPAATWVVPPGAAAYEQLSFTGMAWGGAGWPGATLPPAAQVDLTLCTVLDGGNTLRVADRPGASLLSVTLCQTAGLELAGTGEIAVRDSIVDVTGAEPLSPPAPPAAIAAPAGTVVLDRVSVGGDVLARVLECSEVIFDGAIEVEDRFHGCIRFSRVASAVGLPRSHRLAVGTPVPVVSRNRLDPAWWRLRADGDPAITRGAENGSELGVFAQTQAAARLAGFERRLAEFTPVGLATGVIRID